MKPKDATEEDWQLVVDAEKASREKRYGPLANVLLSNENIEENQLRIWNSLKEKRTAAEITGTRANRRAKKKKGGKQVRVASFSETTPLPSPKPVNTEEPSSVPGVFESLMGKAMAATAAAFPEADVAARIQAENLNSALEDAGVLERIERADAPSSSFDDMKNNEASDSVGPSASAVVPKTVSKSQLKRQKKAASKRNRKK